VSCEKFPQANAEVNKGPSTLETNPSKKGKEEKGKTNRLYHAQQYCSRRAVDTADKI
jgi:hypothetical protein